MKDCFLFPSSYRVKAKWSVGWSVANVSKRSCPRSTIDTSKHQIGPIKQLLCICLFLYLSECYLGYVWLHHHHQHTHCNSFVFVYNFCSYFLLWSQSSSLYILLFELIVFFPNSYIFFIPIIIVTFRMCVVIVVESSWYLAKPSSPSTSFKFFCICLAFSYFLLSLRSFWYHPLFLFRCISSSISTWS